MTPKRDLLTYSWRSRSFADADEAHAFKPAFKWVSLAFKLKEHHDRYLYACQKSPAIEDRKRAP